MKFAEPNALYLIWLLPVMVLLFWWGMRRRRKILGGFARKETLVRIVKASDGRRRLYASVLGASALFFMTLAVAGPLYGYRWRTVERKGVDIMVVLDVSRSMLAEDVKPNRLARAKREVIDLLNRLEGDRAGLVAFAGTAFLQCPLTVDYAGYHLFLNALTPDFLPVGGTALADAIDTALAGFDPKSPAERVIIVLTDGEPTLGDTVGAVNRALEAKVVVHVIGVGTPEGAPIPQAGGGFKKDGAGNIVLSKLEEETLRSVAAKAGGTYVAATLDDTDWDVIYEREIRGKMEARTIGDSRTRVWENRYQWPLGVALFLLLVEFLLPAGRSRITGLFLFLLLILSGTPGAEAAGAPGYVREGIRRYESGDYESALQSFVRAQVEEPGVPELSYNAGSAQYKKEDYESALQNFEAAARAEDSELKAKSLFNLGNTQYRLGRYEDSVGSYEEVLKLDPEDEAARKNLEFVKKRIEKMKQEKEQDQKSEDQEDGKENQAPKEDQGQEGQKRSGESGQEQAEQKPDPKEMQGRNEGEKPQENKNSEQEQSGHKQNEDRQAEAKRGEPARPVDPGQGERMLNRLEDRPGRALMPVYRKRKVEKDW